jgi:hypothetical protein
MIKYIPSDIVELIIDYKSGLEHREKMKKILYNIKKEAAIKRFSTGTMTIFNRDPYDIIMDKEEAGKMISILNKCNCCDRHSLNRPDIEKFNEGYLPDYSSSYGTIERAKKVGFINIYMPYNIYFWNLMYIDEKEIVMQSIKRLGRNKKLKQCDCSCRHTCRNICRLYNDEYWDSDESINE